VCRKEPVDNCVPCNPPPKRDDRMDGDEILCDIMVE
jgi:hypothetical protein